MPEEIEEIMDESEIFSPKEYMKSLNVLPMLAFLPNAFQKTIHDTSTRMFIQFCLYKGEWVLAGFRDGEGLLGTVPGVDDDHNNALFMKKITDTGIGDKIGIDSTPYLEDTIEAKAIKKGLKELFNFVSPPCVTPKQEHVSVGWYVKGVKK